MYKLSIRLHLLRNLNNHLMWVHHRPAPCWGLQKGDSASKPHCTGNKIQIMFNREGFTTDSTHKRIHVVHVGLVWLIRGWNKSCTHSLLADTKAQPLSLSDLDLYLFNCQSHIKFELKITVWIWNIEIQSQKCVINYLTIDLKSYFYTVVNKWQLFLLLNAILSSFYALNKRTLSG